MYKCVEKQRDKNGVINGYVIQDLSDNMSIQVTPQLLKQKIASGQVKVSNLTLTSDGRLVDHNDSEEIKQQFNKLNKVDMNRRTLVHKYSNGSNTEQLRYVLNKLKSKRVGKLATQVLVIGLACAAVPGILVCSPNRTINVSAESQMSVSLDENIDLLNSASNIEADVHLLSINKTVDIIVDGQKIGTLSGKFVKLFEKMTFNDSNGDTIAIGKQNPHLVFDNWTVYDKDENVQYIMAEEIKLIFDKYKILDADQNEVGYIKREPAILGIKVVIYDVDDNVIAIITRDPLRKDFSIEIKDNSKMDNISITTISTNFMVKLMLDENRSSNNSNNSNDD